VQDIILSHDAGGYLLKVAAFVDELLVKFYGLEPSTGRQAGGPHSTLMVASPIPRRECSAAHSYSSASAGFGHPFFHAASAATATGTRTA